MEWCGISRREWKTLPGSNAKSHYKGLGLRSLGWADGGGKIHLGGVDDVWLEG